MWKRESGPVSLQQAPIKVCILKKEGGGEEKKKGKEKGNFHYMLLFCLMKNIDNVMDFS